MQFTDFSCNIVIQKIIIIFAVAEGSGETTIKSLKVSEYCVRQKTEVPYSGLAKSISLFFGACILETYKSNQKI